MPHVPTDRPRLVVSGDGTLAAVAEATRVVVVELPACEPISEIGVDPNGEHEVAWLGTPPRLLVLSRFEAHTTVHLLDPHGPQSIAEIELASAVALFATVGLHALVIGAQGAAILTAGDAHLTPYQFPARAKPTVAGAAGNQFVVAIPGTIEEWDPASRVPKRRLRLPRPTTITYVGGSERVVWMVTQQDPHRVDVLPLINRGQPKLHDLPEPIAAISGHPKSDVLAAVGASGRAYVIDLDGRTRLRALAFDGMPQVEAVALVIGRAVGVIAAQRNHPLAFLPLETRDPTFAGPSSLVQTRHDEATPAAEPAAEDLPPPLKPPATAASFVGGLLDAALSIAAKVPAPPVPQRAPQAAPSTGEGPVRLDLRASAGEVDAGPIRFDLRGSPDAPTPTAATRTAKNLAARMAAVREQREQALAGSANPGQPSNALSNETSNEVANDLQSIASGDPSLVDAADQRADSAPRGTASSLVTSSTSNAAKGDTSSNALVTKPSSKPVRTSVAIALDIQPQARGSWRDELVQWVRDVIALRGDAVPMPPPMAAPIDELATRFDLSVAIGPALALLYGTHLAGLDGVAPVDLARVLDHGWDEALGRGELAATGIAHYERSRVRFAPAVQRVLDELPPATGTLVGMPGTVAVLGPCVLVERGDAFDIAAAHAPRAGGAILVGHAELIEDVCFEARARGAAAMLPASKFDGASSGAVIYVADDDADAERLGLPRFG